MRAMRARQMAFLFYAHSIAASARPFKWDASARDLNFAGAPHCAWKRAMTSSGIGRDLIWAESAGSRAAHTRLSTPSTASVPPTINRCSTSKLERRNSLTCDVNLHDVAEPRRGKEARAGVNQRNADDPEGAGKISRLYAERRLEKRPSAPIEEFEETAVEDDPCRVAIAPFDGELPPAEDIGHSICLQLARSVVLGHRRIAQFSGIIFSLFSAILPNK